VTLGRFKDELIPENETDADDESFFALLDSETDSLSELEIVRLQNQLVISEIDAFTKDLTGFLDRARYYGETLGAESISHILANVKYIRKLLE